METEGGGRCGHARGRERIKTQVLVAVYAEYQKAVYDMELVRYRELGLDSMAFRAAMIKLDNEGLIRGLILVPPEETRVERVQAVICDRILPTTRGIALAEAVLKTQTEGSAGAKLKKAAQVLGGLGLEALKAFVLARVGEA